ncbi:DUF58 domain-containing protein [Pararhodonellum marinum]|uniref:DUF58 domain-containing protein n=1 Tax=Pararhodonellum marinum TaxID=2755358 RepID=UPI00188E8FB2|nr:DUF58 domain-containing protein [Pararhodonellum marinum]
MTHQALELIRLNNLQLVAKIVSDAMWTGLHWGKRIGSGTEFEQYKHYEPGDDPKMIDWKLFARSNRYQVRESNIESHLNIRFLVDGSGSMNYKEDGVSRLDYVKILAASLAYLGHQQNDKMSLFVLQNGQMEMKVPAKGHSFQRILVQLESLKAEGKWGNMDPDLPELNSRQKELIFFFSDLFQIDEEWIRLIQSMVSNKREIIIFQILGDHELDFSLKKGMYRFEDLESNRTVELQTKQVATAYRKSISHFLTDLDRELNLPRVRLFRCRLSDPVENILLAYLTSKQKKS